MKSSLLFGAVAAVVCFAPGAMALSPAEVEQRAKAVSVEMLTGVGSGVIIHRQGVGGSPYLYTVITNRHVVCKEKKMCNESEVRSSYQLKTADGQVYQVGQSAIKLLKDGGGDKLDLAIVQFRSSRSYPVAQVADPGSLKVNDTVYTAGFPSGQGWLFGIGRAQAVVNKRLTGDRGGYTVVYNAETLPGMSGGGAFDRNGRLVAVHGQGDKFTKNTQAEDVDSNTVKNEVNSKIGYNRGIPVRWVVQGLGELGILVGNRKPLNQIRVGSPTLAATADEFFIAGFNKLVDPGVDFQAGRREAVAQFNKALTLNPRYAIAYFLRAYAKDYLNDFQGALADHNQAISLNPENANAYYNRGLLKKNNLNDPEGALADFNQAISLNPQEAAAYINRGNLKDNLNDSQGALADYNQAISLNPKFAAAYYNRGNLKKNKLNDPQGALADYNQAISLNPEDTNAYNNRGILKKDQLDDPQGALADYTQAISLNPKNATAYINRGILKDEKLNDPQGALADFNQAISLNLKNATAYYSRGILKNNLNDSQGALADYNQAISLNPKDAKIYYNRGLLKFLKLNDPKGALTDFNQAISLNSQYAKYYHNRGVLKVTRFDDQAGAIADFRTAAKLFRAQGQTEELQRPLEELRRLGATENP
jgi:tetratricopeptide (TPR) repeat protein